MGGATVANRLHDFVYFSAAHHYKGYTLIEPLALAVPIAVTIVSIVFVLLVPKTSSLAVGASAAMAMAVLVPSFSTSAPVAVLAVLGTILVLLLALFRDRDGVVLRRSPYILIGFLLWSAVAGARGAPTNMVLLYLATGVLLTLLVLVVMGAAARGFNVLLPLIGAVLVFEVIVGFSEEFLGGKAMWPRADGSDNISHRVNSVLPLLVGRAMGSTSQPIPYGMLLGFCVLVCLWFAVRDRSILLYSLSVLGVVGMVFSGTRSAFLSLAAALAIWLAFRLARKPVLFYSYLAVGLVGGLAALFVGLSLGGTDLTSSSSYTHRLGILDSAGNLFSRNPLEVLVGSGYESVRSLIASGVVSGEPGIMVIDQEYVRTLAGVGVAGLALLIGAIVAGLRRGTELSRLMIAYLAIGLLAFDGLSWRLIATLFVIAVANGYGRRLDVASLQQPTQVIGAAHRKPSMLARLSSVKADR